MCFQQSHLSFSNYVSLHKHTGTESLRNVMKMKTCSVVSGPGPSFYLLLHLFPLLIWHFHLNFLHGTTKKQNILRRKMYNKTPGYHQDIFRLQKKNSKLKSRKMHKKKILITTLYAFFNKFANSSFFEIGMNEAVKILLFFCLWDIFPF